MNKPFDYDEFALVTSIMPDVIARRVLEERQRRGVSLIDVNDDLITHFVEHSDLQVRWLYTNNETWKQKLDSTDNTGRDWVYMWVNQWADEFLKSPVLYRESHEVKLLTEGKHDAPSCGVET